MLSKKLKSMHVLNNEELKFIKSGSAPDCEEGLELQGYICPENTPMSSPINEDDNPISVGCVAI